MSIKSRAELQGTFITGAKPTQQNFADLTDNYLHISDNLPAVGVLATGDAPATVNSNTVKYTTF